MQPRDTQYRVAAAPADYRRCHDLYQRTHGKRGGRIAWPCIMAERGGKLVGFLGTAPSKKAVVAGPLVVDGEAVQRGGILVMRLVEAYDNLLRHAGIKAYVFGIPARFAPWRKLVAKMGIEPYAAQNGKAWYIRRL